MAKATELLSVDEARARLQLTEAWVVAILDRILPMVARDEDGNGATKPLRILDIGAAQGRIVLSLSRLGYDAWGVEPAPEALKAAEALSQVERLPNHVKEGFAEQLPYGDQEFDIVIATSVFEHVSDLTATLSEAARVLKPGGVLWFNSASSMCPRQMEIRRFPAFGWYPIRVKRMIMKWAARKHPALVGGTKVPAIYWWTERSARTRLTQAGFTEIHNRWQLADTSSFTGLRLRFVKLAQRHAIIRRIGDTLVPGCSYAARAKVITIQNHPGNVAG